jgi:hypothetical protein
LSKFRLSALVSRKVGNLKRFGYWDFFFFQFGIELFGVEDYEKDVEGRGKVFEALFLAVEEEGLEGHKLEIKHWFTLESRNSILP